MLTFKESLANAKKDTYWHNTDIINSPYDQKLLAKKWKAKGGVIKTDKSTGYQFGYLEDETPLWRYEPKTNKISYGRGKNVFVYINSL
jgi:hypothetical protein